MLILADRLRLLVGPDYLGTAHAARAIGGVERLPIVAHPVLAREYPDAMLAARVALDRVVRDAAANANARGRFEDLAFRNTIANLPLLLREADAASLAGAFQGRPAIVLGAGPSLDANVEALRPLRSSCLVVAADTAVVPCVKGGLTPHLAVALDPSLDNARHLTRMAVPDSVHLVCEASVDPSVPRAFAGRTFFFRVGRHAPWPWLESVGISLGILEAWGSVVTSALDLAVRAGCSPIVFAGLDLAFTRGQTYCRHTPLDDLWTWRVAAGDRIEDLWAAHRTARPVVMERAIEGGDTPTAAHLVAFRDWIRDYAAARPHIRFVNGTGAGILHGPRIEVASLGDLATSIPTTKMPDITETVSRMRAGARPPAQEADVLDARCGSVASRAPRGAFGASGRGGTNRRRRDGTYRHLANPAGGNDGASRVGTNLCRRAVSGAPLLLARRGACTTRDRSRSIGRLRSDERAEPDARSRVSRPGARSHTPRAAPATGRDAGRDVPRPTRECVGSRPGGGPGRVAARRSSARRDRNQRHPRCDSEQRVSCSARPSALGVLLAPADPRLEAAVMEPCAGDVPLTPGQVGVDALVWQWAHVAAAALEADATVGRIVRCLRAARPPLLPSSRARIGLRMWLASAGSPDRTAGVPVVPFLHDRAVMRASSGLLTLDPASLPDSGAAPSTAHPFHLFALPYPWTPDDAPLRTRRVPWSVIVEPDVLTDRGLGACRLATRLNETQALLTRFDRSGSYVVDQRGHVDRSEAWPRPVDGEIGCGPSGRLAWSWEGAQYVLFRPAPGAPALAWELPWRRCTPSTTARDPRTSPRQTGCGAGALRAVHSPSRQVHTSWPCTGTRRR